MAIKRNRGSEDMVNFSRFGRALHIAKTSQPRSQLASLLLRNQRPRRLALGSQIALGAHQQHGNAGVVGQQLRQPLAVHVVEGGAITHGEEDEEEVGLRVAQGPQAIVVSLAAGVP